MAKHRYVAEGARTEVVFPDDYDWESYRAYVGPLGDYGLFSAMVFSLLTSLGLRQHHRTYTIIENVFYRIINRNKFDALSYY